MSNTTDLIVGKNYRINKYFWNVYPNKDSLAKYGYPLISTTPYLNVAQRECEYWSKYLNKMVYCVGPMVTVKIIEFDGNYIHIQTLETPDNDSIDGWILVQQTKYWVEGCFTESQT